MIISAIILLSLGINFTFVACKYLNVINHYSDGVSASSIRYVRGRRSLFLLFTLMILLITITITLYVFLYFHQEVWHVVCSWWIIKGLVLKDILVILIEFAMGIFMLSTIQPNNTRSTINDYDSSSDSQNTSMLLPLRNDDLSMTD